MQVTAIQSVPGDGPELILWDADGNRAGKMSITARGVDWLPRKHQTPPHSASRWELQRRMESQPRRQGSGSSR